MDLVDDHGSDAGEGLAHLRGEHEIGRLWRGDQQVWRVLCQLAPLFLAGVAGAQGVPLALARAAAPMMLGLTWQPDVGYRYGLALLLVMCTVAIAALWLAQRRVLASAR